MTNNNNGNLWILILLCVACIAVSVLAYVGVYAFTHDYFIAVVGFLCIAAISCVSVWQVFTQFERFRFKSDRKRIEEEIEQEKQSKEETLQTQLQQSSSPTASNEKTAEIEPLQIDCSVEPDKYNSRNSEFLQKQRDKQKQMLEAVVEYIHITMTPYMQPTEIEKLCNEVLMWADDINYIPNPVKVNSPLSTYDVCHFIWNIAERIGKDKHYTGESRGLFIKRMFPDICKEAEVKTLAKNIRAKANEGKIHIDAMMPNDFSFHYDQN